MNHKVCLSPQNEKIFRKCPIKHKIGHGTQIFVIFLILWAAFEGILTIFHDKFYEKVYYDILYFITLLLYYFKHLA